MSRYAIAAGIAVLFALPSGIALYTVQEVQQLQTTVSMLQSEMKPAASSALRSVGTGGDGETPYVELAGLYPQSTLYPVDGAPALRFSDQAPDSPDKPRDFEIGFYKYGPTWYTRNGIIEFWIGSGKEDGKGGGIFSVAGNDNGGGEVQVRNPTDTDSIRLAFHDAEQPTISTEKGTPLHFSALDGLISDSTQTFEQGIVIPVASGYAGRVIRGQWNGGTIVVITAAVSQNSLILITPLTEPKGRWWVSATGDQDGFSLTSSASDEDMDFNWVIIGNGAAN